MQDFVIVLSPKDLVFNQIPPPPEDNEAKLATVVSELKPLKKNCRAAKALVKVKEQLEKDLQKPEEFGIEWKQWLKELVPRLTLCSDDGRTRTKPLTYKNDGQDVVPLYCTQMSSSLKLVQKDAWRLAIIPPKVEGNQKGDVPPGFQLSSMAETEFSRVLRADHSLKKKKKEKVGSRLQTRRVSAAWRTTKPRGAITAWGKPAYG
jgi:hypothetical protein